MPDFKAMYFKMFNRISEAVQVLQKAQHEGETAYIQELDREIKMEEKKED